MQNVGVGIVLLVIGAIIGLSVGMYVSMNQTPSMEEQVKVTIQGIEYTTSDHSVLEIELLNNVPEKNLEGNVTVYQDEKQWTSEVPWYYTGYGEAEIICDSINETQNFRVAYIENYPKATYLDRIIEWNEVSRTIQFLATENLSITKVTFAANNLTTTFATVSVRNTGTTDVIITDASVIGYNVTAATVTSTTIGEGTSGTVTLTLTGWWVAGNLYNIELLSSKGNQFSYAETA